MTAFCLPLAAAGPLHAAAATDRLHPVSASGQPATRRVLRGMGMQWPTRPLLATHPPSTQPATPTTSAQPPLPTAHSPKSHTPAPRGTCRAWPRACTSPRLFTCMHTAPTPPPFAPPPRPPPRPGLPGCSSCAHALCAAPRASLCLCLCLPYGLPLPASTRHQHITNTHHAATTADANNHHHHPQRP